MTVRKPETGTIHKKADNGDVYVNRTNDDRLDLEYTSEAGDAVVRRVWIALRDTGVVRMRTLELAYNYVRETWVRTHEYTQDYNLSDDGETLAGDGSNWDGTGREWTEWARERHVKLLALRFPYDDVSEVSD